MYVDTHRTHKETIPLPCCFSFHPDLSKTKIQNFQIFKNTVNYLHLLNYAKLASEI